MTTTAPGVEVTPILVFEGGPWDGIRMQWPEPTSLTPKRLSLTFTADGIERTIHYSLVRVEGQDSFEKVYAFQRWLYR